jgi:hypothetical protein
MSEDPRTSDFYAPLSHDHWAAIDQGIDEYQAQQRPWWLRVFDLPCFVVLAGAQVVQRRWAEWRRQ